MIPKTILEERAMCTVVLFIWPEKKMCLGNTKDLKKYVKVKVK